MKQLPSLILLAALSIAEPLLAAPRTCDFLEGMAAMIEAAGIEPGRRFTCSKVNALGLVGYLYLPLGPGPHPVVISVGGSEGGTGTAKASGAAFSPSGAAILGLAYFGEQGLPEKLELIPLEYFQKAIQFIEQHPDLDERKIGFLGGSKGGELALLFASVEPRVRTVVASLPSGVVWQSKPFQKTSSWSYQGEPIPFVPFLRGPLFEADQQWPNLYLDSLTQEQRVEEATIAVENINGPVLLISVSRDNIWPSTRLAQIAMDRMIDRAFVHQFEHVVLNDDHYVVENGHVVMGKIREFFRTHLVGAEHVGEAIQRESAQ